MPGVYCTNGLVDGDGKGVEERRTKQSSAVFDPLCALALPSGP